MDQRYRQLQLPEAEIERLKDRIWQDFLAARSNHDARIERFRRYYRMWRGLQTSPSTVDNGAPFEVPLLQWITFGHWARVMSSLLGDDAQIIAKPISPEDQKSAPKIGAYQTWRFFEYMKATNPLTTWAFRSVLYGRAHAYIPYEQEYYWERQEDGTDVERLVYDGPKLVPLWFDQLIVPAQDVSSIDEFEWTIRRVRLTPQQLLDGERRGRYYGITDNWQEIYTHSEMRQERDYWFDDARIESDSAEGVSHASLLGNRDSIEAWQWYGTWRLPKGKQDSRPENLTRRQPNESELLVTYLHKPGIVVGVQDLRDLYPRMRKRRPFVDLGLVKDGSYWCIGLGELCETIQTRNTANYRLFEDAGKLSVGPVVFYRPSSGFDPKVFEYKPNIAIPCEDPAGVNVVRMQADLKFSEMNNQWLKTIAELVTGVSDQSLGQSIDRPNAPTTATGQMALIEQGNVRASLDMSMIREDLSQTLEYIWALDREYAPEEMFFRVTEEDADGLLDVDNGFGTITAAEREHNFDFQLKFATSVWSREAKKQQTLALYQLAMGNPIIATNPKALWMLLNMVWTAMGEANLASILPKPPDMDLPLDPKTEWAKVLKGEEVQANPLDNDDDHIIDHRRRLEQEMTQPEDQRDPQAEAMMQRHIQEHEMQKRQKALLQALAQRAAQEAAMQAQAQQPGLQGPAGTPMPAPQPQQPPAMMPPTPAPWPGPDPGGPAGLGEPPQQ